MAKEMMNYSKDSILFQVIQAMLAQTMHQSEGTTIAKIINVNMIIKT